MHGMTKCIKIGACNESAERVMWKKTRKMKLANKISRSYNFRRLFISAV